MKSVFFLFFLGFLIYPAFAESISVTTDKEFYYTGDTMIVSANKGTTTEILDPDYTLVMINQGRGLTAVIDGPLWEKSGEYTVIVREGTDFGEATFFVNVEKIELADVDRISIKNPKIANAFGDSVLHVSSGMQVQITADIKNNQNFDQEFAYAVTVKENNISSEPRWITGVLAANQELSPSLSWVPKNGGIHELIIQIWNNPLDKLQIAQDVVLEVTVQGDFANKIYQVDENLQQAIQESFEQYSEYFPASLIEYLTRVGLIDG